MNKYAYRHTLSLGLQKSDSNHIHGCLLNNTVLGLQKSDSNHIHGCLLNNKDNVRIQNAGFIGFI
jgi:hypothetical protein